MTFQEIIIELQRFWARRGCLIYQPYDIEKGAGTFNPATFLRCLGSKPCSHMFNLIDASGTISVSERTTYIGRVRKLVVEVAQKYLQLNQ